MKFWVIMLLIVLAVLIGISLVLLQHSLGLSIPGLSDSIPSSVSSDVVSGGGLG